MYAIVNIAGQQYKVEKDQKIFVHRLDGKEGDSLNFDEVLLIDNDKNIVVGEPTLKGARIVGKVLSHPKADKVQVFKKKRRKGYKVRKGHRQYMTEIQIQDIIEKGAAKAAAKTVATIDEKPEVAKEKIPVKKTEAVKKTPATPKKTTAQKPGSAASKPAAKKAADTKTASKPAAKKTVTKKPVAKKSDSGSEEKKE